MNLQKEFEDYAIKHLGVNSFQLQAWNNLQNQIYNNVQVVGGSAPQTPQASMTPYILEERELRVTQMDIFSRMMMDRILWIAGVVNDQMSTVVSAQLLFLAQLDPTADIKMYIDSPGGSVKSGLTMVDTMNLISPDIVTINTGMAASMGSILLGAGTKGKRSMLPSARVMLHQVSSGMQGNIQDMEISWEQSKKYNNRLFEMLGEYTGKDPEKVKKDATRDLWLDCDESLAYGIVDEIVGK